MSDVSNENASPGSAQDVAAMAEENARLRAQLAEENAKLQAAIDASRTAAADVPGSGGLSDEDVRRLEHPEEFASEADFEALEARVTALENASTQTTPEPATTNAL